MSGFDQLPPALVHHPMVTATQQDEIVEVHRPAMDPVNKVMPISSGRCGLFYAGIHPRCASTSSPNPAAMSRSRQSTFARWTAERNLSSLPSLSFSAAKPKTFQIYLIGVFEEGVS